eukprot:GHVL01001232.1.p1 GENE.GHVL01001232.1~~GHVL01001232.1.p1  ORF type:complete len:778 (+),score=298.34 GHVL01001232.1:27-2360(+)
MLKCHKKILKRYFCTNKDILKLFQSDITDDRYQLQEYFSKLSKNIYLYPYGSDPPKKNLKIFKNFIPKNIDEYNIYIEFIASFKLRFNYEINVDFRELEKIIYNNIYKNDIKNNDITCNNDINNILINIYFYSSFLNNNKIIDNIIMNNINKLYFEENNINNIILLLYSICRTNNKILLKYIFNILNKNDMLNLDINNSCNLFITVTKLISDNNIACIYPNNFWPKNPKYIDDINLNIINDNIINIYEYNNINFLKNILYNIINKINNDNINNKNNETNNINNNDVSDNINNEKIDIYKISSVFNAYSILINIKDKTNYFPFEYNINEIENNLNIFETYFLRRINIMNGISISSILNGLCRIYQFHKRLHKQLHSSIQTQIEYLLSSIYSDSSSRYSCIERLNNDPNGNNIRIASITPLGLLIMSQSLCNMPYWRPTTAKLMCRRIIYQIHEADDNYSDISTLSHAASFFNYQYTNDVWNCTSEILTAVSKRLLLNNNNNNNINNNKNQINMNNNMSNDDRHINIYDKNNLNINNYINNDNDNYNNIINDNYINNNNNNMNYNMNNNMNNNNMNNNNMNNNNMNYNMNNNNNMNNINMNNEMDFNNYFYDKNEPLAVVQNRYITNDNRESAIIMRQPTERQFLESSNPQISYKYDQSIDDIYQPVLESPIEPQLLESPIERQLLESPIERQLLESPIERQLQVKPTIMSPPSKDCPRIPPRQESPPIDKVEIQPNVRTKLDRLRDWLREAGQVVENVNRMEFKPAIRNNETAEPSDI